MAYYMKQENFAFTLAYHIHNKPQMSILNTNVDYIDYNPSYQPRRIMKICHRIHNSEFHQTIFRYHSMNSTNPISIKVWKLSKNAIKTKNCNLFNHWNFN